MVATAWTEEKKQHCQQLLQAKLEEGGIAAVQALKPAEVWNNPDNVILHSNNYSKEAFSTNFNRLKTNLIMANGGGGSSGGAAAAGSGGRAAPGAGISAAVSAMAGKFYF